MAKNCVNCGKQINLLSGQNEIIQGSGRVLCDKCYKQVGPNINVLKNSSVPKDIINAHTEAVRIIKESDMIGQVKKDTLQDIETLYQIKDKELNVKEKEEMMERANVLYKEFYEKEARRIRERKIIYAEIVGTRMAQEGGAGITLNSTSYSVLTYYDNGDVELYEGNANAIKPLLKYMKPRNDTRQIIERIDQLEKTIKEYLSNN